MGESEAEKVVRKWREMFEGSDWGIGMKRKVLILEAAHHRGRGRGREEVAKAVEALAREIAN